MFRLSICYHEPADKSAFDLHYADVHVPIVRTIPGLLGLTAGHSPAVTRLRTT
ncbi:EthD family reductase [Rhodococcus sovatensis]|uniref:EthD family reductase n=1 Tax=Rhodococcus sovatensis TaxID=1805840 RepID=A0ABZ2PLC7_9NOCA